MAKNIAAMEQKRPKGLDPELLVVSVAPGRTSAEIARFISSERVDWLPGWHWLVGPSAAALNLAWRRWGITAQLSANGVQHDSLLSVIDSNGYLRVTFPAPCRSTTLSPPFAASGIRKGE
jgi:cytochrome oxidase Cu insertion factor (SCO1/SenC/PrrC family)